jgi:hypothetical protein
MRRAKLLILPLLFTLIASACAEGANKRNRSSDDDDGAGGGSTTASSTGGSKPLIETGCSAVCVNAADAGCPGFDQQQCVGECEAFRSETPESCTTSTDSVLSCWSSATALCVPDGIVFEGCEAQEQGYVECVTSAGSSTTTTTTSGGGTNCAHSECIEGSALISSCSPCAAAICSVDPYCCNTAWDSACVSQAIDSPSCGC